MEYGRERVLFTSFIGLLILAALFVAKDWPVRASIIILLLGSVGLVLVVCQLVLDFNALRGDDAKPERLEVATLEPQVVGEDWKFGVALGALLRHPPDRFSHSASVVFSYT
jgi:hypothetical protein